ncbi:MAG TPA: pyridoxal phosphate-dependent aminotransferase [Thermomicrobiales bacterium]|nr:pyridoxal phosphate-dependent aminotransferase [Thermomicrobiales bacterium]
MNDQIGQRIAGRARELLGVSEMSGPAGAIDLTVAGPDGPAEHVQSAAIAALERGETHYTDRQGILPLREKIAEQSTIEGYPAQPDAVVVTNGGSEALYILLQSVVTPGTGVLVAGAIAPNVARMLVFMGGRVEWIPAGGEIPAGTMASVLLAGNPSPASGIALPHGTIERLAAAALDREMAVIIDRSLAWSAFDPAGMPFADAEIGARVMTAGSFSHAWGMAGWRAGYFTTPLDQRARMQELKQAMSICTSTASQFAALAALEGPNEWLASRRARFLSIRDEAITALDAAGIPAIPPDAWPPLLLDTRLIHPDDRQAAAMIRQSAGVIVGPGSAWGPTARGYTRIRLDADVDALREGIARLAAFHNTCG